MKKTTRPPTKKKCRKPTHSPPSISCGDKEKYILKTISEKKNGILNIREYSRNNDIPRSTIYDKLDKLEELEFIKREKGLGINKITEKGIVYLNNINWGVGSSRGECRKSDNLSTHYHSFKMPIIDRRKFILSNLERLKNKGIKENKLRNLHQIIVNLEDGTLIINPKQIIIRLFDIVNNDVEESDMGCLNRAVEYAEKLKGLGLVTEEVMIEEGHWARMKSALSDFLYKVDNRYFLTLDDGSKFWIDHSDGKREDETNNKIVRERVDGFLNRIGSGKFELSELDKLDDISEMKQMLGAVTKMETARIMEKVEEGRLLLSRDSETKPTKTKLEMMRGYIC